MRKARLDARHRGTRTGITVGPSKNGRVVMVWQGAKIVGHEVIADKEARRMEDTGRPKRRIGVSKIGIKNYVRTGNVNTKRAKGTA